MTVVDTGQVWRPDTIAPSYYWPYQTWGWIYPPWLFPSAPQVCSGDVHVFPCPHCDKCKCGAATIKREMATT